MYDCENIKIGNTRINISDTCITISDTCIHIVDSYKLSKKDIKVIIDALIQDYQGNDVIKNRSRYSILSEIYVHNFCYKLNIFRERTGSVDINYPINRFAETIYKIIGPLCRIFIK